MIGAVCPRCYTKVALGALLCRKCGASWSVSQATINAVEALHAPPKPLTDAEKIAKIRELHSPMQPRAEGQVWMGARPGHPKDVPCEGCATGDPYLDQAWPCETREICDE